MVEVGGLFRLLPFEIKLTMVTRSSNLEIPT